jgi:protein-tyrosine phosphatase
VSRRWRRGLLLLAVLAVGLGVGWSHGRHHLLPRRFHVVEAGQVYRGARQEHYPYRRIVEEHGIRTIVTLLDDIPHHTEDVEDRIVQEHGLLRLRFEMPGDGRADFDLLDQAAAALARTELRPVFVHCAAGVNRTGAVIAAWRMRHCGWSLDAALAEMDRQGVSWERSPQLLEHMRRYHRERVAGR